MLCATCSVLISATNLPVNFKRKPVWVCQNWFLCCVCFSNLQDPSTTSYRLNHTSPPKSNSTLNDSPSVVSHGNTSLISGRQSPVYLAVPVDRPPMKVKLKTRAFEQDMADIATINKLRSKLTNADHLGWVMTGKSSNYLECTCSSQDLTIFECLVSSQISNEKFTSQDSVAVS